MSELLKPPAVPSAILNFFAGQPDFPALLGDISEEFHRRAQSSGAGAANRWFWREAFRNAFALTWRELVRTPVRVALTAVGSLVVANLVAVIYVVVNRDLSQVSPPELFSDPNQRLILVVLDLIPPLAMGWIAGKLLYGREWALALTFTLITVCLIGAGFLLRRHLPAIFTPVHPLRQAAFWLGCLWIRYSRRPSLDRRIEAPDRE